MCSLEVKKFGFTKSEFSLSPSVDKTFLHISERSPVGPVPCEGELL